MTGVRIEVVGAKPLAGDLDVAASKLPLAARTITEHAGESLRDRWASNATETSGEHGKWYPKAITASPIPTFAGATVEVGPETGRRQGGMGLGFELGSVNQGPHLDGKRAADVEGPAFEAALEALVGRLL